jgi:hypothetical protein
MSLLATRRAVPGFVDVPNTYQGLPGPGVPNLTERIGPPRRPEPEEQQGVGRGPGERWEHRTHNVTVNPYWYLDRPYLYDVPQQQGPVPVGTETPLPIEFALAYYENQVAAQRHAMTGGASAIVTVPQPRGYPQTRLRTVPHQ